MPQLGMTMTEGFVMRWLKVPGDAVAKGEPLFIVQTDKVDMEVEAPDAGILSELLVKEERMVPVGTVIARIGTAETSKRNGPLVSPRARRVAADFGVDLNTVKGTGEFGRIREADVRAAMAQSATVPAPRMTAESKPIAMVRQVIAERMEESIRTIPHFSVRRELDASALVVLRDRLLPIISSAAGVRLSYTDLLLKALALAVRDFPTLNSRSTVNVGFAAQSKSRLLVPVINNADQLSISQLGRERSELAAKVHEGKITPDQLQGASCTLSNLGAFGVDEFDAIINPPESCILAAGRIAQRPFVVDGQLTARPTLKLTLTVDHRVADGVLAAQCLNAIGKSIEQPLSMLV
jgi:pyruvate dehydrogenase E2 component (dihydrolipoamide acetyltransferase)